MKRFQYIAFGIAFIAILGMAGSHDRAEEILESVSYELYQVIKNDVGTSNEVRIADHYLANKQHYDSIAEANGWE